jgi:hypothetical protein
MNSTTPKRPGRYSTEVNKKVAEKLLPKFVKWLEDEVVVDNEEIIADLACAVDTVPNDGYRIARNLEHMGWDPDAELVEILDSAACIRHDVLEAVDVEWVEQNKLVGPPLESRVTWSKGPVRGPGRVLKNKPYGISHVAFPENVTAPRVFIAPWEELVLIPDEDARA